MSAYNGVILDVKAGIVNQATLLRTGKALENI